MRTDHAAPPPGLKQSNTPVIEATDAVVIGAGPVGLFQVFQLGLQGFKTHVVDVLPHAGGQCVELYGDKPIYDIPGVPACTGQELTDRLQQQIAPFQPTWHFRALVASVQQQPDGRVLVETHTGAQLLARAVFIAAGVGAFMPRTLKTEGIDAFVGSQVFYQVLPPAMETAGRHVVVHGGDEGAVACAVELAEHSQAASITLLHRRDVFQAPPALLERLQQHRNAGRIAVAAAQMLSIVTSRSDASTHGGVHADAHAGAGSAPVRTDVEGQGPANSVDATSATDATDRAKAIDTPECVDPSAPRAPLSALLVANADGTQSTLPTDLLVAVLGISPRLGPLADWGLAMERKQLVVDPATFATSAPGIYAVGDAVTYPGKRKLIVSGFHEATLAAFGAAEWLAGAKAPLEYTSSSERLQRRLGVAPQKA